MINKKSLEVLKCATSDQQHFVIEPITINFGHSICKKCIPKDDLTEIECKLCGLVYKQDLNEPQALQGIQKLLKIYFEDIFKILESETSLKLSELKGILKIKRFK